MVLVVLHVGDKRAISSIFGGLSGLAWLLVVPLSCATDWNLSIVAQGTDSVMWFLMFGSVLIIHFRAQSSTPKSVIDL